MMSDTIFMIHGMWGGAWYWKKFRNIFEAKGYRCVAVNLPYHDMNPKGTPDPLLGTTSLLDYAGFLEIALAPSVIKSFWSVMSKWNFWNKPMRQTFSEAVYSIFQQCLQALINCKTA